VKITTLLLIIIITISSCNNVQSKLNNVEQGLEFAEKNKDDMTEYDWNDLDKKMQELESNLENNRKNYSDEQVKEIGKLQGRYATLLIKKGINDFQESVNDLGTQMEGFIEGITDSTKK
jgi:tetrahydromethanopterin S-methyltransferase subunit G